MVIQLQAIQLCAFLIWNRQSRLCSN